jgi:hypothetical protein
MCPVIETSVYTNARSEVALGLLEFPFLEIHIAEVSSALCHTWVALVLEEGLPSLESSLQESLRLIQLHIILLAPPCRGKLVHRMPQIQQHRGCRGMHLTYCLLVLFQATPQQLNTLLMFLQFRIKCTEVILCV